MTIWDRVERAEWLLFWAAVDEWIEVHYPEVHRRHRHHHHPHPHHLTEVQLTLVEETRS